MKLHILFIGNKFINNETLRSYCLRNVENNLGFAFAINYFKESDNSLFLYLEKLLNSGGNFLIFTGKQNFSTIGKLLCTISSDNQILKDDMLIPQGATLYAQGSYLLAYKESNVNVLQVDEGQKVPQILLKKESINAKIHIFEENIEDLRMILNPLAQTYDVVLGMSIYVEGWVCVDVASKKYGDISKFIHAAKKLLPKKLIASANVVEYIIEKLSHAGKKITFAESCTGGLLAYYFTKHNGASKILEGSLVTYSNALKENWLAVSQETLEEHGAVSAAVVEEMSEGALNVSQADYALAVSGIAGDTGGTAQKPVGTVYIGVRNKEQHIQRHFLFHGDRNYVQHQSALMAIKMLLLLDKEIFF
jgi:nicotinamide-nucleotide amidase